MTELQHEVRPLAAIARQAPDGVALVVTPAEVLAAIGDEAQGAIALDLAALQSEGERRAALDTAMRSLVASGQLHHDPEGTVRIRGPLSLAVSARRGVDRVTLLRRQTEFGDTEVAAYHVDDIHLITEEVVSAGLHGFRLWHIDHAVGRLAERFGFDLPAAGGEPFDPVLGRFEGDDFQPEGDEAGPLIDDMAHAMQVTVALTCGGGEPGAAPHWTEVSIIDGHSGTTWVVLHGEESAVVHDARTVDLAGLLADLLTGAPIDQGPSGQIT